jgi:hypothetical protein
MCTEAVTMEFINQGVALNTHAKVKERVELYLYSSCVFT